MFQFNCKTGLDIIILHYENFRLPYDFEQIRIYSKGILTYLHKILQNPACNRLYIYVHREGIEPMMMANECLS